MVGSWEQAFEQCNKRFGIERYISIFDGLSVSSSLAVAATIFSEQ